MIKKLRENGMDFELIKPLLIKSDKKVLLLVMDGLGGLPGKDGKTELEYAKTPNLDEYAKKGINGLHEPVGTGITPGSGPSHLALFGYNPVKYAAGRGVLSALGTGYDLGPDEIAARGNFATIDKDEIITDRRAGRISTEENERLCKKLSGVEIDGIEIHLKTVKEHRFLFVIRGKDMHANINDTDPSKPGVKAEEAKAGENKSAKTADIVNKFMKEAREKLKDEEKANSVLLRGFAKKPDWPTFEEVTGMRACSIAGYPMYKGLTKLLGMDVKETGDTIKDEFETLKKEWDNYDFFYLHVKKTDSRGEDGNFDAKVKVIEETDRELEALKELKPDVFAVTGDHSTPAVMASHSWHPVPVLIYSELCRTDECRYFGEREAAKGGLGAFFPGENIMAVLLANSGRLTKYGA